MKLKLITIAIVIILLTGCEPGYENRYRIRNSTTESCEYTLYWRNEALHRYSGTLKVDAEKIISKEAGLGNAYNGFQFWAETLFVNDSIRIIPCDTAMFITNSEDNSDGDYTLILTDSLIKYHKKLVQEYGDSIYNCFEGYWANIMSPNKR